MVGKRLSELADLVGGRVVGEGGVEIRRVTSIEEAGPGDITFLAHRRYRVHLEKCQASAIIVSEDFVPPSGSHQNLLQVSEVYWAFAKVLQALAPAPNYGGEVSASAVIDSSAVLEERVAVFPDVYIGGGVAVGRGTVLYPGVFLGERVRVGEDCVFYPHVTVREGSRIGSRVVLHPGVVIGSDGFGYAGEGRERIKIPQLGMVEVGDDVEIGANTTVDRATLGRTVIGRGVKIDNLVQIAHNVVVGDDSLIVAQVGIAGSTVIGKEVILAGQVGVLNHLEIGDRVRIGPQSGVAQSVPAGAVLSSGIAAAPHQVWLRVQRVLPRLPKLWSTVKSLERQVAKLEQVCLLH